MEIQKIIRYLLQNSRIFREFEEAEMVDILQFSKSKSFKDGEVVIKENTKGSDFFIIVTGSVMIRKNNKTIDVLHAGECFGEMGAMSDTRRSATSESKGETLLLNIDMQKLDLMGPEIQAKFYRNIALVLTERLRKRVEDIAH